jgi:hypothetical protein
VRSQAAFSLAQLGQSDEAVINALLGAWRDEDSYVREKAIEGLTQLKFADAKQEQKALITLHQHLHNHKIRNDVFKALRQFLNGKQLPGYRWQSLCEQKERWAWIRRPWVEKSVLITVIGVLLVILGLDNWFVQSLGIIAIAYTILPLLFFPPKDS